MRKDIILRHPRHNLRHIRALLFTARRHSCLLVYQLMTM